MLYTARKFTGVLEDLANPRVRIHLFFGLSLASIFLAWYVGVWPGPIGQDGYSLIANINEGAPKYTGKDPAWLLYALATYGTTKHIETIILPLLAIHIIVLTRITSWIYLEISRKSAYLLFVFICCAPHAINYASSLYPDSIFSLAFVGLLFELWILSKKDKLSLATILPIFILVPIGMFFKSNGIVALVPIIFLCWKKSKPVRLFLIGTVLFWAASLNILGKMNDLGRGHGALKPLILYETVNFMQTRPMGLWENQHMVTDKTKDIIHRYINQEDIDRLYDRDYWDTLWHKNQDRVKLRHMTKQDYREIRKEFFKYNLWRNLPAFLSSRVNIFLASALAQGGMVGPDNAKFVMENIETKSKYSPLTTETYRSAIRNIYDFSYGKRFLLWTPLLGLSLLFICLSKTFVRSDLMGFIICLTLLLQLIGIATFSIAAEYRYLLIFFYSPIILVPIFTLAKRNNTPAA